MLKRWDRFARFIENGKVCITNWRSSGEVEGGLTVRKRPSGSGDGL
jgi:hypothetical protein